MKVSDRIKDRGNLTPTENQIMHYVRENPDKAVSMSLDELSKTIYVSKSTIIRFCKKLGFHGHKELCVELAKELSTFSPDNTEIDVSMPFSAKDTHAEAARKMMNLHYKAVNDTFSVIDTEPLYELAKTIFEGKTVLVYAIGESNLCAQDFSFRLQSLGYSVYTNTVPDSILIKAFSQNVNTAALFISYSSRDPVLAQAARILNEKNVPVFLVSGPSVSTLKKLADTVIEVGFYEPQPRHITIGSRCAVFYILDVLYAMVFDMDVEKHTALLKADSEFRRRPDNGDAF